MEHKDFFDQRYDSIQTLRAISALFVILEHIRFLNCGAFGVDIFFCISGFMIMLSTHKSTRHYIKKRVIRILPLYYIMTLGTFLLLILFPSMFEQTKADPLFLLKSLLFIPFDIGNGILQPLMRIGWTVNCEIFFYLLFFAAFHISHKYRGFICSGFLGGIVLLNHFLQTDSAPLNFYGDPVMLDFVWGILCFYAAKSIYSLYQQHKGHRPLAYVCLIGAVCLLVLLVITKPTINILSFRRPLLWGFPAFLVVLCFFTAGLTLKMPRISVVVGNMSFSIYLIHYYPIMFLDRAVFDFSHYSPFSIFGVVISLLLCLLCSYISWSLIEQKLTHCLQKQLCRRG